MSGNIQISNLGKAYRQYPTKGARLLEWLDPRDKPHHTLKWVLRDVNFQINPGEAVGIIGVNGAGKSTLLKLITGTITPTEGRIEKSGRITAMLELGMGFHPDFTGRQNLFMAGQLIGLSQAEITELLPEIERFAEIGAAIDEPVRVYSSGMYVRLAFSLATAVRPDILIVDEALSVGDAYFQHKCFDRIRDYSKAGTSLLFVSHDAGAIRNLCSRAILLNGGRVAHNGEPEEVLEYYNALLVEGGNAQVALPSLDRSEGGVRSGSGKVAIEGVRLFSAGKPAQLFTPGDEMSIEVGIRVIEAVPDLCVGLAIRDRFGNCLLGTNTELMGKNFAATEVGARLTVRFRLPHLAIGAGHYSISMALHDPRSHIVSNYDWWDRAAMFEVMSPVGAETIGLCAMPVEFDAPGASPATIGESAA